MAVRTPFRTSDVDEAREVLVAAYYSNFLDVLDRQRSFRAEFAIGRLGAVTVGGLTCNTDVRVRLGELGAYHVNIPLSGHMTWRQGSAAPVLTTPDSVQVKARCAPITSLLSRLTRAPVWVRVKKATGMRWTWSYSRARRS